MATLSRRNGRGYVQYAGPRGTRPTLKLGKAGKAQHEEMRGHVRALLYAKATNTAPPMHTARWLEGVGAALHVELARHGLVETREARDAVMLAAFLDGYITKRTDLKPRTIENLKQARRALVKFFGPNRNIATITEGDAADWHREQKSAYARATVSTFVKKARQMFADAISRRMISNNPFQKIKAGKQANEARMEYIARETIQRVIDACPGAEWRLLFALARHAGVRVPSEIRGMTWSDANLPAARLTVRSPKTEHHEGRAIRVVPIVPELLPYFEDALLAAEDGAVYVFARLRRRALVTQAEKIIERATVPRWKKLWQNLRSSCQTDLEKRFGPSIACAWMGNSEKIAREHYFQVTEDDFRRASTELSAAVSVDGTGQHRTESEKPNEKPRGKPGAAAPEVPPRGAIPDPEKPGECPSDPAGVSSRVSKSALRRALRRTKNAVHSAVFKAEIARLRRGEGAL